MSTIEKRFCRSSPWRLLARRVTLPWALQGIELQGDVLEVGAGSGAMAAGILDRFPAVHITATDLDPEMLAKAEATLSPYGARADTARVDVTGLPYADGSFDAVLSFIMLHHVGDWPTAVGEMVRVLRPGGHLIGFDLRKGVGTESARRLGWQHGAGFVSLPRLRRVLGELPLDGVQLKDSARSLVRFRGIRAA
jgi:ubiquinone/menaquinone biosynthesis C-methylase UbiE